MENNEQFKKDLLNVCGNFAKTSLDCIEKQNTELEQLQNEKQQLIKFLKSKIKEIDNEIKIKQLTQQGNLGLLQEIHELRIISLIYQEVLDFVRDDKDE